MARVKNALVFRDGQLVTTGQILPDVHLRELALAGCQGHAAVLFRTATGTVEKTADSSRRTEIAVLDRAGKRG